MKLLVPSLMLSLMLNGSVIAQDEGVAPQEVVDEIKENCSSYAIEEEIPKEELENYMLTCVNDELEESGYKRLERL